VERGDGSRSAGYTGRVWASAAVRWWIRGWRSSLDHCRQQIGPEGRNLPGSIGQDTRIDAERLTPSMRAVEQLGDCRIPRIDHAVFGDDLQGYDGALS